MFQAFDRDVMVICLMFVGLLFKMSSVISFSLEILAFPNFWLVIFFKDFIYKEEKGGRKRGRETSM